jgi:hypothetical protein
MRRPSTGQPAERTSKATSAAIDAHIRAVEAAAGKLTSEQADRLRALLPASANTVRRAKDVRRTRVPSPARPSETAPTYRLFPALK